MYILLFNYNRLTLCIWSLQIELKTTVGTAGMGYSGTSTRSDQPNQPKPNVWEKAQKRYQQLSSSPSTSHEDYDLE